jgi:MscS family membrane protein
MNFEVLDKMFYGNTILAWGTCLLTIVLAIAVAKILYWIFKNLVRKLTSKTESQIDDIIVDVIEEPISLAIGIFGIRIGFAFLNFSPAFESFKGKAFEFLIILNIVWLADRLINSFFEKYLIPLSDNVLSKN